MLVDGIEGPWATWCGAAGTLGEERWMTCQTETLVTTTTTPRTSARAIPLRRLRRLVAGLDSLPWSAVWSCGALTAVDGMERWQGRDWAVSGPASRWFSPQEQGLFFVLVESVEQRSGQIEEGIVVAHHREAPDQHIQPRSLGSPVAVVGEIGLVHNPGDLDQHRILQLVSLQEGLEAAVAPVVGKLDADHVEGGGVGGDLIGVPDEHELRLGIDETADQPCAGRPVDMAAP